MAQGNSPGLVRCPRRIWFALLVYMGGAVLLEGIDPPPSRAGPDLGWRISLHLEDVAAADLWRGLQGASGLPVMAFLTEAPDRISVSIEDEPLGQALDGLASQLGARWRDLGGVIVFGPLDKPPPPTPPTFMDKEEQAITWLRSLDEDQFSDLARGRLLPLDGLTPSQVKGLEDALPQGDAGSLAPAVAGGVPAVGVFFQPGLAVYAGDQLGDVETARPYLLLRPRKQIGVGQDRRRTLPPSEFAKDAEGYLVPWEPKRGGER